MATELQVGDPAPQFSLKAQGNRNHSLSDYKGKWVVLYFYPKDDTPGCTKEACSFRDNFAKFQKLGIQVFGISVDDVESHGEFVKKFNLPFSLLADTEKKVSELYGALSSAKYSDRMTFVIKPDQTIARVFKKVNAAVHADEVLEAIEKN
jgi:peroxiredoxin Q/BCP